MASSSKTFHELVNDLHPPKFKIWITPKTRAAAAEALGKSRNAEAVQPLVMALRDKDRTVRETAAAGISELPVPNKLKPAVIKGLMEFNKKLMDEYMVIETLGPKLRQTYLPKFRKVLPEVKVARYYQIENKINAALMYELAKNIPLLKTAK